MFKKMLLLALGLLVMGSFFACVSLKYYTPKSSAEAAIKMVLLTWEHSWNNHDEEGVLALYHEEAKIMYGTDRQIVSKEEYVEIIPERMEEAPTVQFGTPRIKISRDEAVVNIILSMKEHDTPCTFHLVRENDKWFIMSFEYTI